MAKTNEKQQESGSTETYQFTAETGKILELMIHSLYEKKEIFIRELISNSSDACDKLRYLATTSSDFLQSDEELAIKIELNEKENTFTISDNGIGMSKDDLIENLGTIAKSGTENFLKALKDKKGDLNLIGQFGVGFYSVFMVADEVKVISRKAGTQEAWEWHSSASSGYTILPSEEKLTNGTIIKLKLKESCKEFTDKYRVSFIVKSYSNHIPFSIELKDSDGATENVNEGSALWTKNKSQITSQEYTDFYKHVAHAGDEPWLVMHNKVEGKVSYTNLLFIPSSKPFDLFHPDRKTRVKLYVKRVFISEENVKILPAHLRFLQGIIDSEDLPLNISRETLQHNNKLEQIRDSVVKKTLSELKKKAENEKEEFKKFWNNFGSIIKEGLCEFGDSNRELLLEVCRFRTTKSGDNLVSLDEYIANMKIDQKEIYFLSGDNIENLLNSPQLEGFAKKDIEVILLTDPVDDFWTQTIHNYKDKDLCSITRSGINLEDNKLDEDKKEESSDEKELTKKIVDFFKQNLNGKVADVIASKRLADSPVCLSVPEGSMDIRMERFLISQNQISKAAPKILEFNPHHPIIEYLANNMDNKISIDLANLLLDQAKIIEGEVITDTNDFAKRFNNLIKFATLKQE